MSQKEQRKNCDNTKRTAPGESIVVNVKILINIQQGNEWKDSIIHGQIPPGQEAKCFLEDGACANLDLSFFGTVIHCTGEGEMWYRREGGKETEDEHRETIIEWETDREISMRSQEIPIDGGLKDRKAVCYTTAARSTTDLNIASNS